VHPLRAAILEKLDGRTASAKDLAGELDERIATVSYHLLVLHELGAVRETGQRQVRGATQHFFTATWRIRLVAERIDR